MVEQWNSDGGTVWWNSVVDSGKVMVEQSNKAKLESKIYKHFSIFSLVEFLQKSATSLWRLLKLKLSFQRS